MQQEVSFYSDGYKLWARLFIPDDYKTGERRAALLECPGFHSGGVDLTKLPPSFRGRAGVTERILEAGYLILSVQCRGMGTSEGRYRFPRTRFNPFEQIEDLRNSITYLQQRPEVDPDKIGAIGLSFGGALSPYLAAVDNRIKCCAALFGIGDGEEWMRRIRRHWEFRAFKKRVAADLRQQVSTGQPEFVDPSEILPEVPDPQSKELHKLIPTDLRYTLDSAYYIMNFKAVDLVDKIICPLMVVAAEEDGVAPADDFVRVYQRAREPKKLIMLPDVTHHQVWRDPELVETFAVPLARWFGQWLPSR